MNRPPSAAGIPIVGEKKYDDTTVFPLGPFKLWPPVKFDEVWILLLAQLASGSPSTVKVLAAADVEIVAYLAERSEGLGDVGAPVCIQAMPDGQVNIETIQRRKLDA